MKEDAFAAELGLAGANKNPDEWRTVNVVRESSMTGKQKAAALLSGAGICLFGATVGIAAAMKFMPQWFEKSIEKDWSASIVSVAENVNTLGVSQQSLAAQVNELTMQNEIMTVVLGEILPLLATRQQEPPKKEVAAVKPKPKKKQRVRRKRSDNAPQPPAPRRNQSKPQPEPEPEVAQSRGVSEVRLPWQVVDKDAFGISGLDENLVVTDAGAVGIGQKVDGLEGVVVRVSPQENMVITTSKIYIVEENQQ